MLVAGPSLPAINGAPDMLRSAGILLSGGGPGTRLDETKLGMIKGESFSAMRKCNGASGEKPWSMRTVYLPERLLHVTIFESNRNLLIARAGRGLMKTRGRVDDGEICKSKRSCR